MHTGDLLPVRNGGSLTDVDLSSVPARYTGYTALLYFRPRLSHTKTVPGSSFVSVNDEKYGVLKIKRVFAKIRYTSSLFALNQLLAKTK